MIRICFRHEVRCHEHGGVIDILVASVTSVAAVLVLQMTCGGMRVLAGVVCWDRLYVFWVHRPWWAPFVLCQHRRTLSLEQSKIIHTNVRPDLVYYLYPERPAIGPTAPFTGWLPITLVRSIVAP